MKDNNDKVEEFVKADSTSRKGILGVFVLKILAALILGAGIGLVFSNFESFQYQIVGSLYFLLGFSTWMLSELKKNSIETNSIDAYLSFKVQWLERELDLDNGDFAEFLRAKGEGGFAEIYENRLEAEEDILKELNWSEVNE